MGSFLGDLASKLSPGSTSKEGQDTLKLMINGKTYEGWEQAQVKRSLKAISGAFSLTVVDKWAEKQIAWDLHPGDQCTLLIGTETMITGYLDTVSPKFDANGRSISITGRDKAGDMVDCSVENFSQVQFVTLNDLARRLATPFGIGVKSEITFNPLVPSWQINDSESAFENLERAARLCGVLIINDGLGNIVITRAGKTRASSEIVQGENILEASADYDHKDRFSKYTVKTQARNIGGGGDDDTAGELQGKGVALDPGVTRYRPLVVINESAGVPATAVRRAKWEASVRMGKSSKINVTVPGWRQVNGSLWKINEITKVKSAWLGVNLEFLITEVTFNKGDGTKTQLLLESVQAYDPDPSYIDKKDAWRQLYLKETSR